MLAAFIGKLSEGSSYEEAMCYGGAAGNAAASQLEDITIDNIQEYLSFMMIKKVA